MAQAGYTPISLYYSTTASAVPTSGNLANGELGLNINDMKLYAKNSAGTVTLLASSGGAAGTVSSVAVSGGTTGLTTSGGPITTSGTITLAGTLATTNGGTVLTSFTANGVVYASSTSALATGSALTFNGTNLGLGITLSNWSGGFKAIQNQGTTILSGGTLDGYMAQNYFNDGANKYISTGFATSYGQSTGQHIWYIAPSGTAGNPVTFTQAMTLDANGTLIVGSTSAMATSASNRGQVSANGSSDSVFVLGVGGTATSRIYTTSSSTTVGTYTNTPLILDTNSTQRFLIGTAGQFGIGATPSYGNAGEVLTSGGSGAAPTWAAAGGGSQAFVAFGSTGGF